MADQKTEKGGAEMTGIQIILQENLTAPHVLVGLTEDAAVVTPLAKVLEAMGGFQNGKTSIALLPCVTLASDGVLVQDHLVQMPAGAVFWFEVPKPGRIRSMLGTITQEAEETVSAFLRCYLIANGDVLVAAKTKLAHEKALQAIMGMLPPPPHSPEADGLSETNTDGLYGSFRQGGEN